MCGIAGLFSSRIGSREDLLDVAGTMASVITHRGPDDAGTWVDPEAGVGLGFRRLSIIDLSPAGHQPMISASGRYVIVYNGEVYNFESIRRALQQEGTAPAFRGHSDTEVILAAVETFGLESAVKRFVGMFAFALWDRKARSLSLVRDRIGVKPLHFGWEGETLLFGSELKALRAHPSFTGEIDRDALALFMRHNYVPAPFTIYRGYQKLRPGTILTILDPRRRTIEEKTYWSAREVAEAGQRNLLPLNDAEAGRELEELLCDSVRLRMIADVPLGVFLSGGIDSATVAALMQAQSSRPVKTFTIGFAEADYDEAPYARRVAKHLGTEHTELYVSPAEAQSVVPRLPTLFDEPFADSSQIPTYLVSALARREVTVSLSGDGGDELFGGYNRYFLGRSIWSKVGWLPTVLRKPVAGVISRFHPAFWNRASEALTAISSGRIRLPNAADKARKLAHVLGSAAPDAMYRELVSHWQNPTDLVLGSDEPRAHLTEPRNWPSIDDFSVRMMFHDLVTYLPDDILVKVDRASMGVSLESREPLLDHRLVEFAWRLPLQMKLRNGEGKWLLRQVLYRHVPKKLLQRPKMGFGIPIDSWLRGPLRDWAESLLDERVLRKDGFLDPLPIRQKWDEHLAGTRNWQYLLWDVLMFQAWLNENRKTSRAVAVEKELTVA